ncbi:hypothetical protein MKY34_11180 [Sporosarcina sp. FSL K6-1522]|uniref:hypothetical protein n=1 Tax=Sporosarcina sp. FSL K6-1522 TaxID=2921554 RepID=UPI00315A7065
MLTTLTKKVSRQQLYIHGHFSRNELYELRKDGWRVEWQEKTQPKQNKNGIPMSAPARRRRVSYGERRRVL